VVDMEVEDEGDVEFLCYHRKLVTIIGVESVVLCKHQTEDKLQERDVEILGMVDLSVAPLNDIPLILGQEVSRGQGAEVIREGLACSCHGLLQLGWIVEEQLELGVVNVDLLLHRTKTSKCLCGCGLLRVQL
jgi:hypothetical protein